VRLAIVVVAAALAFPGGAAAHVTFSPPFVEGGVATEIAAVVPNERPPHATVAVRAVMPTGVSIESAPAPPGWKASVDGATVTWSGGRIEGRGEVEFSLRIQADVRPGTTSVAASQTYDDGAVVRWQSDLSVLPPPGDAATSERPWGAIAAAVVGIGVITGSLLLLRFFRRRSLQDP
jgi:uncharacterized protein YcnI